MQQKWLDKIQVIFANMGRFSMLRDTYVVVRTYEDGEYILSDSIIYGNNW